MIPHKRSLSVYTSPKVENFQIFILSPLHPSGKPYLAKSEIGSPVKLVSFNFYRSDHQLSWSALTFIAQYYSILLHVPNAKPED